MHQLESTQRKVTDMIGVAEIILHKERLKERSTSSVERKQINKTTTTENPKTTCKSCFQIHKMNSKVEELFSVHCEYNKEQYVYIAAKKINFSLCKDSDT